VPHAKLVGATCDPIQSKESHNERSCCIAFPTEAKAEEVRQKLLGMQKEYLIELGDAVIAVKDAKGQIKLNQLLNTTAIGAVSGTFWGTLIGLIFLMPLVGAALGAAGGALTDVGINDNWMKETGAAISPAQQRYFCWSAKSPQCLTAPRERGAQ
jgi:uncharacterized membrane protein